MKLSRDEIEILAPTSSVFFDEIFYNPEVCSNCFRQLREIDPFPEDTYTGSRLATHPTEFRNLGPDASPGHSVRVHDDYGELRTYKPRIYCGACGRDGSAEVESPPLSEMLERAETMVEQFDRLSIPCDFESVKDSLKRSNSHDELGGYSTERYALAAAQGVAEGRRQAQLGTNTTAEADAD